jgi:alkanesulfonate monooxygenase SsuD/methylene tetrahydromethanopterin reductase-like flavin-dependent oxidoreductase (luciferase family)
MELGIYSFAEVTEDPTTGQTISPHDRLKDLLEEIELADQVGPDVFGLGEHHRPDFASSAPAVVLAAAAVRTARIRLTSAVTVLSSDDPVRVYQQFSTLDLLSDGRAKIMAGRGSFIESFPLFGYDLKDYNELFAEKLGLLLELQASERDMDWRSSRWSARPSCVSASIQSEVSDLGCRRRDAGVGTSHRDVGPADGRRHHRWWNTRIRLDRRLLSRAAGQQSGHDLSALAVSINSHGYVAETSQAAISESYPYHAVTMKKIAAERSFAPPSLERYTMETALAGAQVVGSPEQVAEKILYQYDLFRHQRFLMQISVGTMPHVNVMKSIELFGTKVAPAVWAESARRASSVVDANEAATIFL